MAKATTKNSYIVIADDHSKYLEVYMMKAAETDAQFATIEEGILADWQTNKIFEKQNELRKDSKEFAFYDGPPFANGLPHYGHLLANTIKDTVPRYWLMRGYRVRRRFGWDCHGLPVEFEIEKREGLKGRPDILKLGVGKFNEMCRDSVLHYSEEWKKTISRLGRWVDWDDQYRTMDKKYMESVWWVFSQLHKKGLIYQGFKIVPYSPRTSSVVSNFEANQNYREVQDPSVTVKFKLKDEDCWILAWTTTPWTLPANLALAVGPDIDYVKIKDMESSEIWILAKSRLSALYPKKKAGNQGASFEVLEELPSGDLIGQSYEPMFPYFASQKGAFKIISAEFVSTDNGTGVVHQAPAFGEDDYFACRQHGIELVDPIDENGCFNESVGDYFGQYFKDADKNICKDLKASGKLIRHETIVHSYPHDERTDTPLMYKAVPSWYVAVEKIVDRLVANNQKIRWVPSHIKDGRMGTWLKNARDWAISRNRFWGTPLPVWICNKNSEHMNVIESVEDLENKTNRKIEDIHKHFISGLTYQCDLCDGAMQAVDVVFDCWFESGSMPYAQIHHPFENSENFEDRFPANFVAEGLDQTRGWFYTLNVLSTALYDKPAFHNVVVNGVILDDSGRKMSKRHRNYTPPESLIDKYGADSIRLYMLNSPLLRAENLVFKDQGVQEVTRAVLIPLLNAYSFLSTYALAENWVPTKQHAAGSPPDVVHDLDRWIVSKVQSLVETVNQHMVEYKLYLVIGPVIGFIEDLTNWYIRLSRRRFWGQSDVQTVDQESAFATLYYVMLEFSKVFAPFAPFISEHLFQHLTEAQKEVPESVHLCDFPQVQESYRDSLLETQMDLLRRATNLGRSLRQKHRLKTRQALPAMLVITHNSEDQLAIERGQELLKTELNIKRIDFTTEETDHLNLQLKPNLKTLGKRLGKDLKQFKVDLESLNQDPSKVATLLHSLTEKDCVEVFGYELGKNDFLINRSPKDERLIATEDGVSVLLDTSLTPDLVAEGHARELVNRVQNLRKDSKLEVSDRISLQVFGDQVILDAAKNFQAYLKSETLALRLSFCETKDACTNRHQQTYEIEGMHCVVALQAETD